MKLTQPIIQYYGLEDLSAIDQATVKKISADYHKKIQRSLGKQTSLKVHIKTHDTEGKKRKYSVVLTAVAADRTFTSHLADWDINRALHKTFKYLDREILKKKRPEDVGIGGKSQRGWPKKKK
ncbi:hypothetical protein GF371_05370 [Candidatus Woesearchaeota archaeon]|nr:hypothetical protein [Candidatus Woesearchaeota archaeon]